MKDGWDLCTLGNTFTTVTGSTPSKSNKEFYGAYIPFVKPPELLDGQVESSQDSLSEQGQRSARIAPIGSILISCIGNLGKIGIATRDVAFNQQINAILPDQSKAHPKFMFYQALSPSFKSQLDALATGTTVSIVNKSRFNSIEVVLPPLEEQKRIVSVLDQAFEGLDRAHSNAEISLESAKELFDSFAANIFSTQTDRWANCAIGEVITLQRGIDITKKDQRKGPVPVVSSGGIKSYHDTAHARGPGVIVGRKGSIGSVHFVDEDYWPHDTTLWVRDFKGNEPRLVYFLLKGINLVELDTGTANPSLNRNLVHKINISWPSGDLQKEVVKELEDCSTKSDKLKDYYQDKIQDISDLRQSLLQKAFSGELT